MTTHLQKIYKMTNPDNFHNCINSKSRVKRPLIIFGAGGHAISVANVALSAGYTIKYFVDKNKIGARLLGFDVVGDIAGLDDLIACDFGVAVGDNAIRERIRDELTAKSSFLEFPSLIHASATVSSFASVGKGTVIMPKAVVGVNSKIGEFCLINTHASIDHDSVMLDYSSLAPGAITGGAVHIGKRSAISMGAIIKQGIKIGDDSVVGASSYLNRDLPDNVVAYGIPARQIRFRNHGDVYLK